MMDSLLRLSLLALLMGLMTGCSEPTLDTSSMPAAVVSAQEVRESLPDYKREEFDKALSIIAMTSVRGLDVLHPGRMSGAEIAETANAYMHGLTGDEVIKRADEMLRQRRAHEREQALRTLRRLDAKQQQAAMDQAQLAKVKIEKADYYVSASPYGAPEPVIELSVSNQSDQRLSQLQLHGLLTSPETAEPWVDERFYYMIPHGLAPGETAEWSLAPNRFGPWGQSDIPAQATLSLELLGVLDEAGEPLWNTPALSDDEAARLDALHAEFGGILDLQ